jgi:large subunit ribosomal protein L1
METIKVIQELRKEKKRKFVQSVDLIINLKNFDVRREALNTFVFIPHGSEKKIAAFFTKRNDNVDTITEEDFVKYKELKDIKKLAKKYDAFMAVAPMMGKVATKFGRVFGPMNKMPSPLSGIVPKEDDNMVNAMLDKMGKAIRVKNKEMSIKVSVGKEDMSDEELAENIDEAIAELTKKLPRGRDNVKNVLVKFTMTKAVVAMDRSARSTPKKLSEGAK